MKKIILFLPLLLLISVVPAYSQESTTQDLYDAHETLIQFWLSEIQQSESSSQISNQTPDLPIFITFVDSNKNEIIIGIDYDTTQKIGDLSIQIEDIIGSDIPYVLKRGYVIEEACNADDERCDPLWGSIEIGRGTSLSSLTLPAITNNGKYGFIMSGHGAGGLTNVNIDQPHQNFPGSITVGSVITNPSSSGTPASRASDAAFVEEVDGISSEQKIFNPNGIAYNVIGTRDSQVNDNIILGGTQGKTVNNSVVTHTTGQVLSTGVTITSPTWGFLTNQVVADYISTGGDSGAPIFSISNENDVEFHGLHQGVTCFTDIPPNTQDPTCPPNSIQYRIYSPWESIQAELNLAEIDGSFINFIAPWLKTLAGWWHDDKITDNVYLNNIKYMVKENYLNIDAKRVTVGENKIKSWIKQVANLWVIGDVDDVTYANALIWLIENGIIVLDTPITTDSSGSNDPGVNSPTPNPSSPGVTATKTVTMASNYGTPACGSNCFVPSVLSISTGDSVTFTNSKSSPTVIASGHPSSGTDGTFNSGPIGTGLGFTHKFIKAGTYNYFDLVSPWMQGTITVGATSTNKPPTANAGTDKTADEDTIVILSGTGTDPEKSILRYTWKQLTGTSVQLSGSSYPGGSTKAQSTFFIAPKVSSTETLTFQLTVKDNILQSGTDTVSVSVKDVGTPKNTAPVAHAGADTPYNEGSLVTLSGSSSSDADGDSLTYAWTQTTGPDVTTDPFFTSKSPKPKFTAPQVNGPVNFVFKLLVHDGTESSQPDLVKITINNIPKPPDPKNTPPVADAGIDQTVVEHDGTDPPVFTAVTLNGTGSSDADGDTITYKWEQILGPSVKLSSTTTSQPTFTTSDVSQSTLLDFKLTVNDGTVDSRGSIVRININPVLIGPVPNLPLVPYPDVSNGGAFGHSITSAVITTSNDVIIVGAPEKDVTQLSSDGESFFNPEISNDAIGNTPVTPTVSPTITISESLDSAKIIDENTGKKLFDITRIVKYDGVNTPNWNDISKLLPSNDSVGSNNDPLILAVNNSTGYSYLFDETTPTILATTIDRAGGIYILNATDGTKIHSIDNPTPKPNEYFGWSVAANDSIIAISAYEEESLAKDAGAVYLYDYSKKLLHTINNPVPGSGDNFGYSVFLTDTKLIVGAPSDDTTASNAGSVYVYSTAGVLLNTINHDKAGAKFGYAVSATPDGTKILVGAESEKLVGQFAPVGAVYVYDTSGKQVTKIVNPKAIGTNDDYDYPNFGRSIVPYNNTAVIIGAPLFDNAAGISAGTVFVHDISSGKKLLQLNNTNPNSSDNFGASLSVIDGNIVVGTPRDGYDTYTTAGSVSLFDNTGSLVAYITNPNPVTGEKFGESVSSIGNKILVGVPDDTQFSGNSGSIYMLQQSDYTPTANAGLDFTVRSADTNIPLDGSSSFDSANRALTYKWIQTFGSTVSLSSLTASQPTFDAPTTQTDLLLFFELVVDNGIVSSVVDSVTVNVIGVIVDTTQPVITLLGNNPITIDKDSTYNDAGATARDNIDGDITSSIVTVNPVDTSTVGTYTITYDVSDKSGNKASQVSRTVLVVITVGVPDTPTSLLLTPGDSEVSLSWTAPTDNGGSPITDYKIQYQISSDTKWKNHEPKTISNVTSTVIVKLENDVTYKFRVAAENSIGRGAFTTPVSATPLFHNTLIEVTRLQHDPLRSFYNSLVRVDSDTFALAYQTQIPTGGWLGHLTTFTIPADGKTIKEVTSLDLDVASHFGSLVQIDSDTVALAYTAGKLLDEGIITTYNISADGKTLKEVTSLKHNDRYNADNSFIKIDSDTYALAYGGSNREGILTTFTISADGKTIKEVASLKYIDTSYSYDNSLVQVDSDTFVLSYQTGFGSDWLGHLTTFTISADGKTIKEVTSLDLDVASYYGSLVQVDSDTFALAHQTKFGSDWMGYITTFTISADGKTIKEVANLLFSDKHYANDNSLIKIAPNTVALAYTGDNTVKGSITTYTISADGKTIKEVASLIHSNKSFHNSLVQVDSDTVALAYVHHLDKSILKTIDMTFVNSSTPLSDIPVNGESIFPSNDLVDSETTYKIINLQTIPGNGQVTLSWNLFDDIDVVTDYIIEYKTIFDASYYIFDDGLSTSTSSIVTGLQNNVEYEFMITAKNFKSFGSTSNTVSAIPMHDLSQK